MTAETYPLTDYPHLPLATITVCNAESEIEEFEIQKIPYAYRVKAGDKEYSQSTLPFLVNHIAQDYVIVKMTFYSERYLMPVDLM